jgi:hypothetical protein
MMGRCRGGGGAFETRQARTARGSFWLDIVYPGTSFSLSCALQQVLELYEKQCQYLLKWKRQ